MSEIKEETTVILERLIESMDLTVPVSDVQGDKIYLCKTLHLRELRLIEDENGNEYQVVDYSNNEWIQVIPTGAGPNPFEGKVVVCPPITHLYGTPSSTDDEYQQIEVKSGQKTPLIWYWWNPDRDRHFGKKSSLDREIRPKLVFLDETDEESWTNEDHFNYSIQPMFNLINLFIETVNETSIFKTLEDYETIKRPRFGRYIDPQGNESMIIDEHFSGVELQPTLVKYKEFSCKNC